MTREARSLDEPASPVRIATSQRKVKIMPQPTPVGPVLSLFSNPDAQLWPHLVGLADGKYLVAWHDELNDDVNLLLFNNLGGSNNGFSFNQIQTTLAPSGNSPREL